MKICAYGSLKQGFWNNERFGRMAFVGKDTLEDFALYLTTAPYPFLVREEGFSVEVEVYEVTRAQYDAIERMEQGAGYVTLAVQTAYGPSHVWVLNAPPDGAERFLGLSWNGEHL